MSSYEQAGIGDYTRVQVQGQFNVIDPKPNLKRKELSKRPNLLFFLPLPTVRSCLHLSNSDCLPYLHSHNASFAYGFAVANVYLNWTHSYPFPVEAPPPHRIHIRVSSFTHSSPVPRVAMTQLHRAKSLI